METRPISCRHGTDVERRSPTPKAVDFLLVSSADAVANAWRSQPVDGLAKVAGELAGTPVRVRRVPDTKTIMVMGPEEDIAKP